jgi:hypothetical protein
MRNNRAPIESQIASQEIEHDCAIREGREQPGRKRYQDNAEQQQEIEP